MKRRQVAAIVVSALSLLHSASAGAVRRKRTYNYLVVNDEEGHENGRHLKGKKGSGKKGSGKSKKKVAKLDGNVDLDTMTVAELEEYLSALHAAQSFPETGTKQPTKMPTLAPGSGSETVSPTFQTSGGPGNTCNGLTRRQALAQILEKLTDNSTLANSTTPQGQAYSWMLDKDPAEINPCVYPSVQQRYILASLYFATGGQNWDDNLRWLSSSNECDWFGIICDSGDVISIDLRKFPLLNELFFLPEIHKAGSPAIFSTSVPRTHVFQAKTTWMES